MPRIHPRQTVSATLLLASLLAVVCVASSPAMAQCPMCRTGLTGSAEGHQMAAAFNHGILLLLAVPLALVSIIGFRVWRALRLSALSNEDQVLD